MADTLMGTEVFWLLVITSALSSSNQILWFAVQKLSLWWCAPLKGTVSAYSRQEVA